MRIIALTLFAIVAGAGYGQEDEDVGGRARAEWLRRAYPSMSVDPMVHLRAWKAWQAMPGGDEVSAQASGPDWVSIGPDQLAGNFTGKIAGRVTAVAVHPTSPSIVYAGTSEGGVWKTTDAGATWTPLTDRQSSLQCDAIAIDPKNPNIVYAGTGSILPILTHSSAVHSYVAYGLLKSTDAGATWQVFGTAEMSGQPVQRIIVDPANSNRLYVAATNGVWLSQDGGVSYTKLLDGFITDLALIPGMKNTLYAAAGDLFGTTQNGLYISRDDGANWSLANGAPVGLTVGRMEIAVAPSNTNIAYMAASKPAPSADLLGIYKTINGGQSWSAVGVFPADSVDYHWFCLTLNVHPTNSNVVLFGGLQLFRTIDGGGSWTKTADTYHVDQHCLAFAPSNPDILYLGNDGGLFRGSNIAGAISWTDANTNICSVLFYSVATHPTNNNISIGGMQDNGVGIYGGGRNWSDYNYADGVRAIIDQKTPTRMYYSIQYGMPLRSTNGGQTWSSLPYNLERAIFMAPFMADPTTSSTLYIGSYRLWKSTNMGSNWTAISGDLTYNIGNEVSGCSAIGVAPNDSNRIYVGTGDGRLWTTPDGGAHWTDLTGKVPNRWVTAIAVDPADANRCYVGLGGYGTSHLWRTDDAGATFRDVSENLPDLIVNDIEFDPITPRQIYIANEFGLVVGDGQGFWYRVGRSLPFVAVTAVAPTAATNTIRVSTLGRGMWDIPLRRNVMSNITLDDWDGPDEVIHFDLLSESDGVVVASWDLLPLDGLTQIPNVPTGKWLVRAKGRTWLSQTKQLFQIGGDSGEVDFDLLNGDFDGNNRVDINDLVGVLLLFGTDDLAGDLTGDDQVTLLDLVTVLKNFTLSGD